MSQKMEAARERGPARKWPLMASRLAPIGVAMALVALVFWALRTYEQSSEQLAQQHNQQHLRVIQTLADSLQDRLSNMQAAFNHYATLIHSPFDAHSSAAQVCAEIEQTFSRMVSLAFIVNAAPDRDPHWREKQAELALTSASTSKLSQAASKPHATMLLLHSTEGRTMLVFLTPIVRNAPAHLAVVVPFERLLAPYHINDERYDKDYLWILGRDGTLVYHPEHPEMLGNNINSDRHECRKCHESFDLEHEMVRGKIGYGWNEVPKGAGKIVAYAPLDAGNLRWSIAISESMDLTTSVVQQHTRMFTIIAVLISLLILGTAVYVTHANDLRHEALREAQHLQQERKLQHQLERKNAQLLESERFATVGRMAAQMAHEIKNPLSSISLNTELLGDELNVNGRKSSAEARQLIDSILSEIDLLSQTLDEYLQFARFPKLERRQISLSELCGQLNQLLREEATSRGIRLECSVPSTLPQICADPRLLHQGLLNLIRNAFEAIGQNGRVRLDAACENGDIRLVVADTGPGVKSEHLPMLFEPFFTTKPKGTGLGLPLTRHIIYEHGGSISYESTGATGACFVITLPVDNPLSARHQA
jgi:signal transduction histidine kinase